MTPKEKAIEMTLKYYNFGKHIYISISFAKQCALIAVDEIIENTFCKFKTEYWKEVKQEIENL